MCKIHYFVDMIDGPNYLFNYSKVIDFHKD